MQLIQHAPRRAAQAPASGCPAGLLADLIDGQARMPPAAPGTAGMGRTNPAGADRLIWIEDDRGPATFRNRGLLVVTHGAGRAAQERSCVISYPGGPAGNGATDTGDILAVSDSLATMGWRLLSCRDQATETGHASIAILISRTRPGREKRLWLVAPSAGPSAERATPTPAPAGQDAPAVPPPYPAGAGVPAAPGTRDQVEVWVNEGGAGDDVAT